MDTSMMWIGLVVAAIGLGVHGGYQGALVTACLKIGTGLEGASEGTTGFQDALTPPSSTNARIYNWIATLMLIGASWYYLGGGAVAAFIGLRVLALVVAGASLKSEPPKPHFVRKIYVSMANREADYVKNGDSLRAQAIGDLRSRFERSPFSKLVA